MLKFWSKRCALYVVDNVTRAAPCVHVLTRVVPPSGHRYIDLSALQQSPVSRGRTGNLARIPPGTDWKRPLCTMDSVSLLPWLPCLHLLHRAITLNAYLICDFLCFPGICFRVLQNGFKRFKVGRGVGFCPWQQGDSNRPLYFQPGGLLHQDESFCTNSLFYSWVLVSV